MNKAILAFCILHSAFCMMAAADISPAPADSPARQPAGIASADGQPLPASAWTDGWREEARVVGAASAADFAKALDGVLAPAANEVSADGVLQDDPAQKAGALSRFAEDPATFLAKHGIALTLLLVVLAGLLLNLTPCVLPMIPVNLALIGAGTEGAGKARGAILGSAYGAGMALAYGMPGAAIVAAGGGFIGAIQSSPWFNLVAALLFVALALAMLDVFFIDFTRFRKDGGGTTGIVAAAAAGAATALLAGACVAPVTIAVLLLAGSLYAAGHHAALLLPFALGAGMALPWPALGAGLANMPRPGMWMVWIKRGLAVFMILLAARHARLAWIGFRPGGGAKGADAAEQFEAGDIGSWRKALDSAAAAGKPVLVDFGASWCRNCDEMDEMFANDPEISSRLENFAVLRVRVEQPRAREEREMLSALGIQGLPTFLMLLPADSR